MAKKTANKEMKPKKQKKEEVIKPVIIPEGKYVRIFLFNDGLNYVVGRELAKELIDLGRAKLA